MFTARDAAGRSDFRNLGKGRYDIAPWLESQGLHSPPSSSAILDIPSRTLVFINNGENIELIECLFRPLYPVRYRRL